MIGIAMNLKRSLRQALLGLSWLAISATIISLPHAAQAGLLEDDEARRAILDLRNRMDAQQKQIAEILLRLEKLDTMTRGQLTLVQEQDSVKRDLATLRGELEVATNEIAQTQRRSRDLYTDLEQRLKQLEPKPVQVDGKTVAVAQEQLQTYEQAMAQFKAGDFAAANTSFDAFIRRYPDSAYAPSALYFKGSAQYAQKDYKAAISTQQELIKQHPSSNRAPEAMLNIASNQMELKDRAAAKKTLEKLIENYPDSQAANIARERLRGLK